MEGSSTSFDDLRVPLKLLLFIDKRPSLARQMRQIKQYLKTLETHFEFNLDVVDIGEQPYLAEHYKLVASPALIKISPAPQQMLAGSDIVNQLERWWPKWQQEHLDSLNLVGVGADSDPTVDALAQETDLLTTSAELMKLSDEIFRLNQTREELEAQLRFKDRIIAMMAHDLRNPLTAASIAVETLELGYAPNQTRNITLSPELTGQLLKHAKTQIRAINRMITDILKAARGASMELQIVPQELNLSALCLEVVDAFQNRLQEKQQSLTTEIPQDLPTVYADGTQVKRVVTNLLDNAIKYTPEGGQVSIIALHRTTQKVQVAVVDTGPGIPPENRDKIFEESYRLQRDVTQDGYGLGLALCQRIVRAHYGQIWVDSAPGAGSSFFFTLPVYRA
ncbi:histidine kinase [Phormidium tenue]|uniref:Adaptive-response sensory-kinase SasA n=1 Tax=Phormidium tenue NIES-30 TaxID=549789 RepID=A0A1U7J0B0_9CYAN|nr:histidine kinase [Phormidium tenue]MBD2234344.1 histidine kinase [Phormidium tenue FACHB-1052]OKH44987.1 histidine kinase [Phormidium tenue NIES-30]